MAKQVEECFIQVRIDDSDRVPGITCDFSYFHVRIVLCIGREKQFSHPLLCRRRAIILNLPTYPGQICIELFIESSESQFLVAFVRMAFPCRRPPSNQAGT